MAQPKLTLVDELFAELPPAKDDQEARLREAEKRVVARFAGSITKRGRQLERNETAADRARLQGQHEGEIAGIKQAHAEETQRVGKIITKAAHRDGLFQGVVIGAALVAMLALGAFTLIRESVILNTATQRVNYPQPPTLQDNYQEPEYERHPREPGS